MMPGVGSLLDREFIWSLVSQGPDELSCMHKKSVLVPSTAGCLAVSSEMSKSREGFSIVPHP